MSVEVKHRICLIIFAVITFGIIDCGNLDQARIGINVPNSCRATGIHADKFRRQTITAARNWVPLYPYTARHVYDEKPSSVSQELARKEGEIYLGVYSFPQSEEQALIKRSFLYDNALALLWYAWIDETPKARGIARTLGLLQNNDGSWGFSFSLDNGFYNAEYVRNGAVAWAAYALSYYAKRHNDPEADQVAHKAVYYLLSQKNRNTGLIKGGRGFWIGKTNDIYVPYRPFDISVAEHQLDLYPALAMSRPDDARRIANSIIKHLWLAEQGRFALAMNGKSVDVGRALDSAGAWGALFLNLIGLQEDAKKSYEYTKANFAIQGDVFAGFFPYLDELDGPMPNNWHRHVFFEGTMSMGLAAHRLGDIETALEVLRLGLQVSCAQGPGVLYSNIEAPNFPREPAVAPTLWLLFLEREMRTNEISPLFNIADLSS